MRLIPVALAATLALAACSPASDANEDPTPSPTDAAVVIDERPLEDQLIEAVRAVDIPRTEALLGAGADPNTDIGAGLTALHSAVATESPALVQALLDGGAETDAQTDSGETPLVRACLSDDLETIEVLLAAGADHAATGNDTFGSTCLHLAARYGHNDVLRALIAAGADVNQPNAVFGATPLSTAAFYGNVEALQILFASGADLDARSDDGTTALGWARAEGQVAAIEYLESLQAEE